MKKLYKIITLLLFFRVSYAQVTVDSISITAEFYGPFNKTTAEIYLFNPSNTDSIEARVPLYLNKTSFVENLWLDIGGELKKAKTIERWEGEKIYEKITRKKIDPALLLKTFEGSYLLNVYPFLKNQKRKVIIEYYSVLESDAENHLTWYFELPFFLKPSKKTFHLSAIQPKGTKLYSIQSNSLNEIELSRKNKDFIEINSSITVGDQFKFCFDYQNIKYPVAYYSDNFQYYQTKSSNDSLTVKLLDLSNMFTYSQDYIPDFIKKVFVEITKGNIQPLTIIGYGIKKYGFGVDNFLLSFLDYFKKIYNLTYEVKDKLSVNDYGEEYFRVNDNYNWSLQSNLWSYEDKNLTMIPVTDKKEQVSRKKIKCPILKKFEEYLFSLTEDIDSIAKRGFLNSQLAKIVIEEDERAIRIWENITHEKYSNDATNFVAYEIMPEPIGGFKAIHNLIFFPEALSNNKREGKIYLLAFIHQDGRLGKVETIKPLYSEQSEAYYANYLMSRIAYFALNMIKWIPGRHRGKNLTMQVSIPIVIKQDSTPRTMECNINERIFRVDVPDSSKIYLVEKDFDEAQSEIVQYNSDKYFEILLQNLDLIEIAYLSIYKSKFDGLAIKSISNNKNNYYFIKK